MKHLTPLEALRSEHRQLLNQQAELSIQARTLAEQVNTVTNELTDIQRTITLYAAVIRILDTAARTAQQQPSATTPRKRVTK